ncbi:glycosyltransferase [Streptomyces sp. NPDC006739]|uniref:glycosyltransferase n=1 Tax=Streptomyces sp. NPDC006739 TaxID=3364763 RepID=UPI0036B7D44F
MSPGPAISVVVPTFDRAALLRGCLDSFARQTLGHDAYEVIVVDDGSTDDTALVCAGADHTFPLRYYRTVHAGTSAAKNLGLFLARAPIVLFFDDDDVAAPDLLAEHLAGHREHPEETVAVLGHTGWAPQLPVSHLMHYVTEVDGLLYDYGHMTDGARYDFRHFWAGRLSCKRGLLVSRALFRSAFDVGLEDIELGWRLDRYGLRVAYRSSARQFTARPVTLDGFLDRCSRHGRARRALAAAYPQDPVIQDYCVVHADPDRRAARSRLFADRTAAARALEARLGPHIDPHHPRTAVDELYRLYGWCFRAAMTRAEDIRPSHYAPPQTMSTQGRPGPTRPRPAAAPPRRAEEAAR